ncbi:MAG TPA: PIG-L family deacetylase, partial [Puia sp.]|nr:PIG-L family deacetylase [Puia sp.]
FCLFLLIKYSVAQIPESENASDILLRMKKLKVLGSVLYIAAHPDDENTRLLAWLSKDRLYRTGYLSLTRGDGGQNLIGDEQGIELGLIRTQELMAARKIDGADQFFSRAYDFGFSKTTAEALKIWDEQKILSDVVWIIRNFQPDVIITRFPEDKRAGHGQHSASSVLARMAYTAAADPKQFPEQFTYGVSPWQAKRIFWNNYNFGNVNTTREDQLKIEVGGYNTLLGKSYGEIAADSRSQHRSQGFGIAHTRGNFLEYFSLTDGEKADSSLLQNINCSWSRIPNGAPIGQLIERLIKNYDAAAPYQSLQSLVEIYQHINALAPGYWRNIKLQETLELIHSCSGLWLEATVPHGYAVRNQTIPITLRVVNRAPLGITIRSIAVNGQDTSWNLEMQPGVNYSLVRQISLKGLPISQPYWLREPMSPGSFNVQDQTMIGRPLNPPVLDAVFEVRLLGESFKFTQSVFYRITDAVKGELFEPFTIVPAQMAYCDPDLLVFTDGREKELMVKKQLKTAQDEDENNGLMHPAVLSTEKKHSVNASSISLTPIPGFQTKDISHSGTLNEFLLKSNLEKNQNVATWVVRTKNGTTDTLLQCRTISYEHIPRIDYFKQAKSTVVSVNLKTAGKKIGYIEGAGDKVPDALSAMGFSVIKLNEDMVTSSVLQNLDAVITGVRAYDVHDWLAGKYRVLMEYIKNGGNLIVQYNRNLGGDSTGIGPYPFGISNARVTEEDAPVQFILPSHPVLHFPNEISDKDFDGWIQERGIYFAQHIDPGYQAVFSMHDSGEAEQKGSLIIGHYGKGFFSYTGLVFFRELPAGIPGAYRLFANLIGLNQSKGN